MLKSKRLLGEGFQPHVDEVGGKLIYSIPISRGVVDFDHQFEISQNDFEVLKVDSEKYQLLFDVLHDIFQNEYLGKEDEGTRIKEFERIKDIILHSDSNIVDEFLVEHEDSKRIQRERWARKLPLILFKMKMHTSIQKLRNVWRNIF